MILKSLILLLLFSISFFSCSERDVNTMYIKHNVDVVNLKDEWRAIESYSYSFNALKKRAELEYANKYQLASYIKYNVSVHHITYQTTYKGISVTASGAITIPIGKSNPSIIVLHHGTMFHDTDTPSTLTRESSWGMEFSASNGYIGFFPDYIGYGTTANILHPYHLYRPAVDASIDMIIAGMEFLKTNHITFNDNGVFIGGFSEGGYDAFAVQREIESHPELKIKIKASAPGAGAYNVDYQFSITTDRDVYPGPGYMALALSAYNEYYLHWPLTRFFLPDYAEKIPDLISGKYEEAYVHAQLPKKLSGFINPDFLKSYKTDSENPFTHYLKENVLTDFAVATPTRFIHGKDDPVVPFAVAEKSYQELLQHGTSQDVLKIVQFDGDHNSLIYQQLMLDWFNTF